MTRREDVQGEGGGEGRCPTTQEVQIRKKRRLGPAPVIIEPPKSKCKSVKEMLQCLSARNASKGSIQPTGKVQENAGCSQSLNQHDHQLSGRPTFRGLSQ